MANQESFLKLEGKLGDVSFRKTKKGYKAYQKTNVKQSSLLTSPKAEHILQLQREFTRASTYSKMLKDALRPVASHCQDQYLFAKLNAITRRVIIADTQHNEGDRVMNPAIAFELQNFDINTNVPLDTVLYAPMSFVFDAPSLSATLSMPPFKTNDYFKFQQEATHAKLKLSLVFVNFETGKAVVASEYAATNLQKKSETENIDLVVSASNLPTEEFAGAYAVLLLGVEFYRSVNGFENRLYGGALDSLKVLEVNQVFA